eukprot:6195719-Pleurochrysis_carterae.AAC.2
MADGAQRHCAEHASARHAEGRRLKRVLPGAAERQRPGIALHGRYNAGNMDVLRKRWSITWR